MVFLGGCILAELMSADKSNFWMTKAEYEEVGVDRALAAFKM